MEVKVDYVSDVHLGFYIDIKSTKNINKFVDNKINSHNGDILVIAGDISEYNDVVFEFLNLCSKYYDKVFFVAGNHEYYITDLKHIHITGDGKKYDYKSINKIYELSQNFKDNKNIVFLDRNSSNGGIYNYNGFKIAGDTLWYRPNNLLDYLYYYPMQNDSRFIMSDSSYYRKMIQLHNSSMEWYNKNSNDFDLIVSHVPPVRDKKNRSKNCCYYVDVNNGYKSSVWIYGHDHIENDEIYNNTRFVSNPWGYDSKEFKIKSLVLKK